MTRPIFIFYFVFLSLFSFSQENLIFKRITKEDGLSASWVRGIYQDKYGFMWFGTSYGLNRYDGYEIKEYKPSANDPNSIINAGVFAISERDDGKLWICTERGVNIFDRDREVFSAFSFLDDIRVNGVLQDYEGIIWFSSNSGLFRYDPVKETMVNFINDPDDETTISDNTIESIFEDSSHNLWIATQKGLNVFNRNDQSFKSYTHSDDPKSIGGNGVIPVIEDNMGRLWVGNEQSGLDIFINAKDLPDEGIFEHVLQGSINELIIDRKNRLWIGQGLGFGLSVIDLNTFSLEKNNIIPNYNNIPYNLRSLSDNAVTSLFEDKDGGLWVGTFSNGVNYCSPRMKKFNSVEHIPGDMRSLSDNSVNFFLEEDEYLWIATEFGLSRLDKENNLYTNYFYDPNDPNSIGRDGVICLYKDSYGNIWVGTWNGGLNLFNRDKDNFTRFLPVEGNKDAISNLNVYAIRQDDKGTLWIGTNGGGLNSYNYLTGKFTHYVNDRNDSTTILHDAINDICLTANGELYISTYHSLDLFDYSTGTFKHYVYNDQDTTSITDGNIMDIFEDSRQNLWICTSRGLNYFNRKKEIFIHYTVENGLPSDAIQSILEDRKGNLWLGTNNGISKFINGTEVPNEPEFVNFVMEDGLQGNEFIRRSAHYSNTGLMYFGGTSGYTYFYPDSIFENPVPPVVVLIDFRLFGNHDEDKINVILNEKDVNLLEKLVLSYDQADFTIEYAALNYLNSEKNKYKFKLDGYENEWHNVGYQRSATYTNIQHGKYTFMVRGSNNDGVWSEKTKMLTIIIKPPWWKTIVFRVFAILLFITLIIAFYRIRFALLEKQKHLLEKKVRERTSELSEVNALLEERQEEISLQNDELEKHRNHLEQLVEKRTEQLEEARKFAEASDNLKSAFLANMSHEIRTPMNAIVGFASMLKEEDIPEEEKKEFIDIINSNSQSLLVLINDILEISLIEANQLVLSKDPFDAIQIMQELQSYFVMKNTKKLDIHFNNSENRRELIFQNDKTRFRQVISNLLSNSYKYTEEGAIELGYKLLENEVEFYVSDTGIGINESEYQRIFDYFHKIDKGDNKLYRGAGIGLSICNKLVELMGGRIYLDSDVGKGTTFYFTLPFIETEEKPSVISKVRSKVKYNFKGVTILVAEDEITNYQLLRRIFKPTKAAVIWAKNGEEAVKIVKDTSNFDDLIILMDIKMPVMSGITANEEIKKINKEIPVIAVTAYAQARDKEEILKHNFVDYIAKPLESEKLLKAIAKYLKK